MAIGVAGCALFVRSGDVALDDAHVVSFVRPPCPYVIVKTQGDAFGVLAPPPDVGTRGGDMFVGPLRPGPMALHFVPFPEQALGPQVQVEVHASNISFPEAQTHWRALCGEKDAVKDER